MTEIDHAKVAGECLHAATPAKFPESVEWLNAALVHAVLALAQEQRAANLLAYEALKYGDCSNPRVDKAVRAYIEHATQEQQP